MTKMFVAGGKAMEFKVKKKISLIGHTMDRGGASHVLALLANELAECGWDVDLVFFRVRRRYDISDKVKLVELFKPHARVLPSVAYTKVRKYLKKSGSEVVLSFLMPVNFITILANIGLGKRLIISERNDPKKAANSFYEKLSYKMYPKADYTVFQTNRVRGYYPESMMDKSSIIMNPVHINAVSENTDRKKIVSVGKLYPQKNHKLLIDAFYEFDKKMEGYTLHIYGEGPLRSTLEEQISSLGLSGKVILEGNKSDLMNHIKDAGMFVLSSDYEGLSNALIEAVIMGLPCISTDCAGSDEIITDGEDGLLTPVGDVKKMTEAMLRLAGNNALADKFSIAGRKKEKDFSVEEITNQWIKVIENCN